MEKMFLTVELKGLEGVAHDHMNRLIVPKGTKLSISGVIGPRHNGHAMGGAGRIDMEFLHADETQNDPRYSMDDLIKPSEMHFQEGWNREKWLKLLDIWHRWHLNDMRAGCEHQRAMGWKCNDHHDKKTFKGEACPVCGYSIGSSWLTEELPPEVVEFLINLPESSAKYPWTF